MMGGILEELLEVLLTVNNGFGSFKVDLGVLDEVEGLEDKGLWICRLIASI